MTTAPETTFAAISAGPHTPAHTPAHASARPPAGHHRRRLRARAAAALATAAVSAAAVGTARGQSVAPIALTGWNQDLIAEATTGATTSAFDLPNNYTYYAAGLTTSGGLPTGTFQSANNPNTTFQLQPFAGPNALFVNSQTSYLGTSFNTNTTGLLTLSTPKAYTTLAFLSAAANAGGTDSFSYQLNYADGTASAGSFTTQDWFNGTGAALTNLGRINPTNGGFDSVGSGNPQLYETDVAVPLAAAGKVLDSIQITGFTTPNPSGSQAAIFAVSGLNTPNALIFAGNVGGTPNGAFDTTTADFQGGAVFANGSSATFDDTASTFAVTVAAGGVSPFAVNFNNNADAYTLAGGPIAGTGAVNLNGTGTVTLANANNYSGGTFVNAGTLVLAAGGAIAPAVTVAAGGTFTVLPGASVPNLVLNTAGTVNLNNSNQVVTTLNSPAGTSGVVVNLNGSGYNLAGGSFYGTLNLNGTATNLSGGALYGQVSGTGGLNVLVASTLLADSNNFAGGTTLTTGALTIANLSNGTYVAHPNAIGTGPLTFNGGTLTIPASNATGTFTFPNAIAFGPVVPAKFAVTAGGTSTFTGPVTLPAAGATFATTNYSGTSLFLNTVVLAGVLTGPPTSVINKTIGGTLELDNAADTFGSFQMANGTTIFNAANTYAGYTNVANGSLVVNVAAGLGSTSGITVGAAGTANLASLLYGDTTSTTGGLTPAGAAIPLTIYGAGGGTGAFRLATLGQTSTYAGPIAVGTGGAAIGSGPDGTLTLTGPITTADANSPVVFTSTVGINNNDLIVLAAANTYAGETQIAGYNSSSALLTVQAGVVNAFSPNSGLNFTGTGLDIVDLHGHPSAVAYLTGGSGPFQQVTDNLGSPGGGNSTLTVGGPAATAATVKSFGGLLTGNLSLVKAGPGTQILTLADTYAGTTAVNAGTLAITNAKALSGGVVTLGGGTLQLGGLGGNLSGFANFVGTATVANGSLNLANSGTGNSARAAYFASPETISPTAGFTAQFTLTTPSGSGGADGVTFLIENDSRGTAAVGGYGGGLGYTNVNGGTPVGNSVALSFDQFGNKFGFGTNGSITNTSTPTFNIYNPLLVTVTYNAPTNTLTETIVNTSGKTAANTSTFSYNVNLAAVLGGNAGYVGFTGATGGTTATYNVSNFAFNNGGIASPTSIANPVTTAANTGSFLSTGVSPGFNTAAVGPLSLAAGSKLTLQYSSGTTTRLVLSTPSLTFAGTAAAPAGQLDVGNADLDVTGGGLAAVTAYAAAGYNGGTFNGSGIVSSTALANPNRNTTVGVIANSDPSTGQLYGSGQTLGLFDGANPGANDVLVKYTYFGDANLDGVVNGTDYARIDAGFLANGSLTGWYNGDFNYDGTVDASDYTLIDDAFNTQAGSLRSSVAPGGGTGLSATSTDEIAPVAAAAAVPEPATVGLLAVAAGGLLARRRRA